jgi:hypothetical protein
LTVLLALLLAAGITLEPGGVVADRVPVIEPGVAVRVAPEAEVRPRDGFDWHLQGTFPNVVFIGIPGT